MKFHDDLNIPESHQHPWTTCTFSTWQNNKLELPMSQPGRVWAPKENHRLRLSPLIRKRINSSFGACLNLESFGVVRGRGTKRPSYLAEIIIYIEGFKRHSVGHQTWFRTRLCKSFIFKGEMGMWICSTWLKQHQGHEMGYYLLDISCWNHLALKRTIPTKLASTIMQNSNLQLHLRDLEISIDTSNW